MYLCCIASTMSSADMGAIKYWHGIGGRVSYTWTDIAGVMTVGRVEW